MKIVKGYFRDGVALPEEPIDDRDGQRVLITFLDEQDADQGNEPEPLEAVVARIQGLGKNPANITYPTRSLAELLAESPGDASFDAEAWDLQWAAIEAEMKERDIKDDHAEGRV
jgi:hypothetical protein